MLARLQEAGSELAGEADARGWDVVVAGGDPRLLDALAAGFQPAAARLFRSSQPLAGVPNSDTAERVAATLHDLRSAAAERLVEDLDSTRAATRDRAVVEQALGEGRVDHLLLAPAGQEADEDLVRRAYATGAAVTIVDLPPSELGSGAVAAFPPLVAGD